MAVEGEEVEYESDPEEALLPLTMRRREASDDEGGQDDREKPARTDLRVGIGSDSESDGQGGAPAYEDDEESEEAEEEIDEEEEDEYDERVGDVADDTRGVKILQTTLPESGEESVGFHGDEQGGEEKKENEPFAVPTAGTFYMHDDRFRGSGGGRSRRTPGARKLWESKDNRAWVHDRFEEMNLQEPHYDEERRTSKVHARGRGKKWGNDRGYVRRNRFGAYNENKNQIHTLKSVKGRGPIRYEPLKRSYGENPATQNKQYGKSLEAASNMTNVSSGRVPVHTSSIQSSQVLPRKHVIASSLNSASPPFYPSGSSKQDISATQNRATQTGNISREENFTTSHSSASIRGKNILDTIAQNRLPMDDLIQPVPGKPLAKLQFHRSGSSSSVSASQSTQVKVQEMGITISGQINYQPSSSPNQINRGSVRRPVQSPVQPAFLSSTQQLGHGLSGATHFSPSPPQPPSALSSEFGDVESPPGSSKSKTALVGKGKPSVQGNEMGSFLYNGAQVIGASGTMSVAHGDQSFPATPALLPVMQFAGQNHGGLGVPAVGMALPGYVAQPQLGFGNNEMTWVPVLAGAAGALGATYCSPYIAVDGSYYARPSGQSSSNVSRETTTNKPSNVLKPPQRSELVNEEYGLRQNKPRRYSEMNFGH
eukprot:TRINITY_DN10285_c0_g1_i2.p1 TRINITY_DN10285_c0_g1~~TRINITY_DN10285_c0_g1_i2.p1  ORF type:complete len:654 (-),score=151.03 TRINITY_DN10285_c0_g1_i2:420-2381(-)